MKNTTFELKPNTEIPINTVFFSAEKEEILKLCPNGDIFVKGRLAENDKEVVEALREFIISQGFNLKTNKI